MIQFMASQECGAVTGYHLSPFFIDSAASAPPPRGVSCFSRNLVLFEESIILGKSNRRSLSENRNAPGQLFAECHLCQPNFEPCRGNVKMRTRKRIAAMTCGELSFAQRHVQTSATQTSTGQSAK